MLAEDAVLIDLTRRAKHAEARVKALEEALEEALVYISGCRDFGVVPLLSPAYYAALALLEEGRKR